MSDVRDRILEAATELFGLQGYGGTSVRQVVERAAVTKPTLYYHFENKHALFIEAVALRIRRMEALLQAAQESGGAVLDQLRRFSTDVAGAVLDDVAGWRLIMAARLRDSDGDVDLDLHKVYGSLVVRLAEVVRRGQQAGEIRPSLLAEHAAIMLVSLLHMHVGSLVDQPFAGDLWNDAVGGCESFDPQRWQPTVDDYFDFFLHGVTA